MDVSFLAFDSASDPLQLEIGLRNVKPSPWRLRWLSLSHDEPLRADLKANPVAASRLYDLRRRKAGSTKWNSGNSALSARVRGSASHYLKLWCVEARPGLHAAAA